MIKNIAICIITYKRPIFLRKCISSILNQKLDFDLYIIDNDHNASAKRVVEFMQHDTSSKLNYILEKKKGIPYARNKAVECVKDKYKYLVFIDDDEEADKMWLINLYNAIKKYNVDVIAGPVLPIIENKFFKIADSGAFFRKEKKYINGQIMNTCATSNVIIKMDVFQKYPKPFNEKFKNTGGTDTFFFEKIIQDGFIIKWCNDAIVYEKYEDDRLTLKFNFMRSYRIGNSKAFGLKLRKKYSKILFKIIISILEICISIPLIILTLIVYFMGYKKPFILIIKHIMRTVGFCNGILGYRYEDYK